MILCFDVVIVILVVILVVLILTGYVSLCERKILAIVQMRIGPALFMFGLLTPITDGIKLFLKFIVFVVNFDVFYFLCGIFVVIFCIFFWWFFIPIGFILLIDLSFSIFFLLTLHVCSNLFGIFFIGCFLLSSCFVYLSAMRTLFFCLISEGSLTMLFLVCYVMDAFSFLGIKDLCVGQLFISNFYLGGILFCGFFWVCMLLDGLRLPFDYMECESELVAGLITEFSGVFFVVYSVMEINHLLLCTLLFSSLVFGGIFICFKSLLILCLCFFWPRTLGFRLKITTAQIFILFFLFFSLFFLFLWLAITRTLCLIF